MQIFSFVSQYTINVLNAISIN